MSSSRNSHDSTYSSWGKRKSLFNLPALSLSSSDSTDTTTMNSKFLKRNRQRPSILTDLTPIRNEEIQSAPVGSDSPKQTRPSLSLRSKRPPSSMKGSYRGSLRSASDLEESFHNDEPTSAVSTEASVSFSDSLTEAPTTSKLVIMHGEVQTSAGMFRKKKEYVVLSENAISRYKSQAKAAEIYSSIPSASSAGGRPGTIKHAQMPSYGSSGDMQTVSDSSGEKSGRVPLYQVVAVHTLDDGRPYYTIEVCYLDEESNQSSAVILQYNNHHERDTWLHAIRKAVNESRLREAGHSVSSYNLENAARFVERDHDYDPANCSVYKIVQRQASSKSAGRSSSDDLTKVSSTVAFLAIGVHKIHFIPLAKHVNRTSSPSLITLGSSTSSFGILTISAIRVSDNDDAFELTLRQPLQRHRTLYLASSAAYDIAAQLYSCENLLRPEGGHRFYQFKVPFEVEDLLPPSIVTTAEDHSCLQRTLTAYCIAYGVNPGNVRYSINYECEDAPRFELLPPSDQRRASYGPLELLAILRTLRYNETFGSLSFAGVALDSLHGLHDNYGIEFVCRRTKAGTPIKLTTEELESADLLVQEVRALAATSKKLRRLDFSSCITVSPPAISTLVDDSQQERDTGCGIAEALVPLCRHQITNVDWICLNGINLSDSDLDYLVAAAVERTCHFRAIELNQCGLNDRSVNLVLDALRAQEATLEAVEIAGNAARLDPITFNNQLSIFGFIRKLDLSNISRTSGPEALLQAETLSIWRLSELRLSGTTLNAASVDALATYLSHPNSESLHELHVDSTYLSGGDAAKLLNGMFTTPRHRSMHLDISQNNITKELEKLTQAISRSRTPTHLSMRATEYREESSFRKILAALTVNKSTMYLNMSQTALPGDASDDTCRALGRLITENDCLIELNLSGEESRLATSKFGPGINEALACLKVNKTLKTFHIERQKLGLPGAATLAEVLRHNSTLQELYCEHNEVPLSGLTDLVNALIDNTTLIYLPTMDDGRAAAFKSAEQTMKNMTDTDLPPARIVTNRSVSHGTTASMKKGFASVKRTAQRRASAYTPSFPALPRSSNESKTPIQKTARQSIDSPASPVQFTLQDIQTTHRLLTEQWNRQCYRLAQYLERNWCLLNNIPTGEVEDEKFERPESAGSLAKMLEQVKFDTTPRAEKELYFDAATDPSMLSPAGNEKTNLSFKQFILGSGNASPDSEAEEFAKKIDFDSELTKDTTEPSTPTQARFTLS